jgi:hypothetical protein
MRGRRQSRRRSGPELTAQAKRPSCKVRERNDVHRLDLDRDSRYPDLPKSSAHGALSRTHAGRIAREPWRSIDPDRSPAGFSAKTSTMLRVCDKRLPAYADAVGVRAEIEVSRSAWVAAIDQVKNPFAKF